MKIFEIDKDRYYEDFYSIRTGFSDYYADFQRARFLGGYDDYGESIGFMIFGFNKTYGSIYDAVCNGYYKKPFFDAAFDYIVTTLSATYVEWETDSEYVPSRLLFSRCDTVYRLEKSALPEARKLGERYGGFLENLQSLGYETAQISFSEEENKEIIACYRSLEARGDNSYMDDVLNGDYGKVDENLSYITRKEGKIVAFCVVTRGNEQDNSAMLRYIYSTGKTGVFLLPFRETVMRFFASEYLRLRFTVQTTNKHSRPIVESLPNLFAQKVSITRYEYNTEKQENQI